MTSDDQEQVYAFFSDPKICRTMGLTPMESLSDAIKNINASRRNDQFRWVVRMKDSKDFVGLFWLQDISWKHRRCQIGGGVVPNKWRCGYGFEIVNVLLLYAFDTLQLHRVEAHLYPDNLATKELFLKSGFKIEGRLRQNYRCDGMVGDTLIMGILSSDRNDD